MATATLVNAFDFFTDRTITHTATDKRYRLNVDGIDACMDMVDAEGLGDYITQTDAEDIFETVVRKGRTAYTTLVK